MSKEADEARMAAIFGRHRVRAAKAAPPPPALPLNQARGPVSTPSTSMAQPASPPAEARAERPPGLRGGPMGLLDEAAERAWEATLSQAEYSKWEALQEALDAAGPEMRWRAAGYVMRAELEHARKVLRIAKNINNEPFKAELISRNGLGFREAIGKLEGRLGGMYDILVPLAGLIDDVESAYRMVTSWHMTLDRVTQPWHDSWPGAAQGRGIPGFDTPEGIAKVRAEVKAAHERYTADQARRGADDVAGAAPKQKSKLSRPSRGDEDKQGRFT